MIRIPTAFEGKPSAPGALRLSALLIIIASGWGAFLLSHVFRGMWRVATVDAITVVLTLVVRWATLRTGDPEWIGRGGHLTIVVTVCAIVAVAMLSGQDAAMATWYLTAVPLFAAYHMGSRAAVGWAVGVSIVLAGVYVSPRFIEFEPEYIPDENTWLLGKYILLGVLFGLSVATRRAMDASVEALNEREAIIRERAKELAEARDEALEAVHAKNQFLANMSHEIRTPLNAITGMTSVLLDSDQPADQREMIETIDSSSSALLDIINEILDFSKLQADAVEVEVVPFDLFDCVEDVLDIFGRSAFQKSLDLYFIPNEDVPQWVEGDVTHLRQVLLNLVGNAVKFTQSGSVHVEVDRAPDGELHFAVHDTGIGIPEDKQDRLFRSFSQVDASTTRNYGGTGLGLAISKRLVELMGGHIWLESAPGEGSSFHFTVTAEEIPPPGHAIATHDRIALFGRKVVVVGGQEGTRRSVTSAVASWGPDVRVAESSDALAEMLDDDVDVVVLIEDLGLEASLGDDRPPLLAMVPLADSRLRKRVEQMDVEGVVFLPMRRRTLRQALEAVMFGDGEEHALFTVFDPTMAERLPAAILVGEDNPVNQKVAVSVLQKLGYAPDLAASGEEVLDALDRRPYDIVFLDVHMPGMDGLQTVQTIRRKYPEDDQPWVVALTASVSYEQRAVTRDAGMDDFVPKPFDVQTLMAAIERWATRLGMLETASGPRPQEPSMWEQLNEMFQNSPDRLVSLIEQHLENGRELVQEIERAADEGDTEAIASDAHALKSSSAQFGSNNVASVARNLEALAESASDEEELDDTVAALSAQWTLAEERLRGEIKRLEGAVESTEGRA